VPDCVKSAAKSLPTSMPGCKKIRTASHSFASQPRLLEVKCQNKDISGIFLKQFAHIKNGCTYIHSISLIDCLTPMLLTADQ